ncbi:MAG: hypothetical protein GKR89_09695 [Candidatus Latescibacteria bacterium]|nr:hypothetical protein [Candidatus Latescibacterota bacterium]
MTTTRLKGPLSWTVPCLWGIALLLVGTGAWGRPSLTREQQLNQLKLREHHLLLEQRRASLASYEQERDIAQRLFDQGFIALQEVKQKQNRFEQARLNYAQASIDLDQTKLDLLDNATHIVIAQARKYQSEEGHSMVDIVLHNASDTRDALLVDPSLHEDELRTLLKMENIFVSLEAGPIVGEPYEMRIDSLAVDQSRKLTFRLLQDGASVNVVLQYLEKTDSRSVILTKGNRQDLPTINSAQFSQEGKLNGQLGFDLSLQRLSDEERSFSLAVLGLPAKIEYSFVDQGAVVNQIKFDENTPAARLDLRLQIPRKLPPRFIGVSRPFFALVTLPSQYGQINELKARYGDRAIPEDDIKGLKGNYVKLELTPKGLGQLEVLVANRYQEIEVGQELGLQLEFLNRGTAAVQNIKAELDLPYEWESQVDPDVIRLLEPNQRVQVHVLARPPLDIAVGEYELGIEAQGQVGTEDIQSLEKNIKIHLTAGSNMAGNTVLIGALILLVVGIGLASIRIGRR